MDVVDGSSILLTSVFRAGTYYVNWISLKSNGYNLELSVGTPLPLMSRLLDKIEFSRSNVSWL